MGEKGVIKPSKTQTHNLCQTFLHEIRQMAVLASIFQLSLDEGIVPKDWRSTNVTPIFKKSDRSWPANNMYRLVSLTCISCKILEHTAVKNMVSHLEEHHILVDGRHRFRSGHSCYSQLIITTQDLAKYLDFSKAFNKVPTPASSTNSSFMALKGNTTDGYRLSYLARHRELWWMIKHQIWQMYHLESRKDQS